MNFLKEFFKCFSYPDIWVFYSHKNIILKYKDTILGPFWNIINSIFLISVLSLSYFLFLDPDNFRGFVYRLSISVFFLVIYLKLLEWLYNIIRREKKLT